MNEKRHPEKRKPARRNADKQRERLGGFHAVTSALRRAPEDIINLWIDKERRDPRVRELLLLATEASVAVSEIDRKQLDRLAGDLRHQGVLAEARMAPQKGEDGLYLLLDELTTPLILVLDQIQDPHNLGACLRSADGAGADAVVLPKDGAAPVNDTVRRVAAGAADRVPVFYVTNLSRCLERLQERGIWISGAADQATRTIYDVDFTSPSAVVMGAEGKGLRRLTQEHCDELVSIPMAGSVSSLNVSVATGVVLFEVVRQRLNNL